MLQRPVQAETLEREQKIYDAYYPTVRPLAWQEDGKTQGILIDIGKTLLDQAQIAYRFHPMPLKRYYRSFEQGQFDMTLTISRDGYEQHYLRSEKKVLSITLHAYWLPHSGDIEKFADLAGRSVVKRLGYLFPSVDYQNYKKLNIIVNEVHSNLAAIRMLHYRRADYLLDYDEFFAVAFSRYQPKFELRKTKLGAIAIYCFVNKKLPNAQHILSRVNKHLSELHEGERLKGALEKYIN